MRSTGGTVAGLRRRRNLDRLQSRDAGRERVVPGRRGLCFQCRREDRRDRAGRGRAAGGRRSAAWRNDAPESTNPSVGLLLVEGIGPVQTALIAAPVVSPNRHISFGGPSWAAANRRAAFADDQSGHRPCAARFLLPPPPSGCSAPPPSFWLAAPPAPQAEGRQKIEFWYGLTGQLGDVVQNQCKLFNDSQDKYEAVCVGQGGYDKAEQNTIAAYRSHQQPTIVQIYDAGTVNFLLSGAVYPADKFDQDYKLNIDWKSYYPAIRDFYGTSKGTMWSFPYNSSTAVLYWNKDEWKKIGKTEAPKTWDEFGEDLAALKKAGVACPFAHDFDTWPILEQFSAINDVPVATEDNGFKGLDAKLTFNHTIFVDFMKDVKRWVDDG